MFARNVGLKTTPVCQPACNCLRAVTDNIRGLLLLSRVYRSSVLSDNSNVKEKCRCRDIYSFSGHRFLAESADLYVQELAQGHHTYAVDDIAEAKARLRRQGYDVNRFAHDLYILEMCDQIEAEMAVRTLEGETE